MVEQSNSSGGSGNTLLAVIVGALLVGIAFFFAFGGFEQAEGPGDGVTIIDDDPDVNLEIPAPPPPDETPPAGGN